jgi:hypothetical protein
VTVGLLADEELQGFQLLCFDSRLAPDDLRAVKEVGRVASRCATFWASQLLI